MDAVNSCYSDNLPESDEWSFTRPGGSRPGVSPAMQPGEASQTRSTAARQHGGSAVNNGAVAASAAWFVLYQNA